MRISIRLRLTAWYAAALLLGLGIFALGMWVSLQEGLIAGVDARLSQRMKGGRALLQYVASAAPLCSGISWRESKLLAGAGDACQCNHFDWQSRAFGPRRE